MTEEQKTEQLIERQMQLDTAFEQMLERIHDVVGKQWFTEYELAEWLSVPRQEAKDLICMYEKAGIILRHDKKPKYALTIHVYNDYDATLSHIQSKVQEHYEAIGLAQSAERLLISAAQHAIANKHPEQLNTESHGEEEESNQ
jgi:hypothetical protein